MTPPVRRATAGATLLALLCLTVTAYAPLRGNGFVGIDDPVYLTRNRHVLGGLGAEGLRWAFTTFEAGNWHPLTWVSHMVDVSVFGLRPGPHHLVSLAIHAATAAVLFGVLLLMTGRLWPSAAVAALFAVHPLHVESVAWASERKDVLSGLCFVLSLAAHLRYARRPRPAPLIVLTGTFVLGLLSKPMVVTLPFVLLLLDYWPLGRLGVRGAGSPRVWAEKIPLVACATVASAITLLAQDRGGFLRSAATYPLHGRMANAFLSCAAYLRKTVWPSGLALPYHYPENPVSWRALAAAGLVVAVTVVAARGARRAPAPFVGWCWYLVMLAPVSGIVQVADHGMADRYTYLPLTGVFLALCWGIPALARGARPRRAVAALALAATLACVALANRQSTRWSSDLALFEHAVAAIPDSWLAWDNYASALIDRGRSDEARAVYARMIARGMVHPTVLVNLGALAVRRRDYGEAEAFLREAAARWPGYALAYVNLGALHLQQGRWREALGFYEQAARLGNTDAEGVAARLRSRVPP